MPHTTVARRSEHEDVIKGSRFLAVAVPLGGAASIGELTEALRRRYPDASHHVSAARCGDVQRFDDDGEPGGTAGRPILEVLLRRELDFVEVCVVRWFGGTKLGAGGLVRAYSGAAAKALDGAGTRTVLERVALDVAVGFDQLDVLLRTLDATPRVERGDPRFGAAGAVVRISIPERDRAEVVRALTDATRGAAGVQAVDADDADDAASDDAAKGTDASGGRGGA